MLKVAVKRRILSLLLLTYTFVLRVLRKVKMGAVEGKSVLILPPSFPGSLGDEAIVTAVVDHLREKGVKRIGLISCDPGLQWKRFNSLTETIEVGLYFYYDSWRTKFRFARIASHYDEFYAPGTDVMGGYYSEFRTCQRISLVSLAAKTGADTTILGFSFNDQPTPTSVRALRNLPVDVRLCARDPISHKRLQHHLKRPVELVADLAFLLDPDYNSEVVSHVVQWTTAQQACGRTVIGINTNYLHLQDIKGQSVDHMIEIYKDTLVELYAKGKTFSFVLIPHDYRGQINDVSLAESILKVLPVEMQPHCIQIQSLCSAAEIKAICGSLDIVLSARMHLAIACLGQGTPVACITYQDKFEGLFRHFELDGMTIGPEEAFQPGNLAKFFLHLVENREDIRRHIKLRLPQVEELARANFE